LVLNHTVFVDNSLVFGDMNRLMATGQHPPDKRTPFFLRVGAFIGSARMQPQTD